MVLRFFLQRNALPLSSVYFISTCFFLVCCKFIPLVDNCNALELLSIDFFQEGEISKIEFTFDDKTVKGKKFHIPDDKQIILDLQNVTAKKRVMRAFDTSEFSGSVVMVSPYVKPESINDIRVAIQLRDNVRSMVEKQENKLIVMVENRFGVFSQQKVAESATKASEVAQGIQTEKINVPKSDSLDDILENLTLSGQKKYVGKKISINVKKMPVAGLLRMIADSSGFNIIMDDDVNKIPDLSLVLTNIPWDQALDTIMQLGRLVAKKTGNILTITTAEKAALEEQKKADAKALLATQEPLVTKIFPISFAEIAELSDLLTKYLTKDRGAISRDTRTNSIIVKDTVDTIERMKKIIEVLDTQTPQILIEAKVVEANESFSSEIGLRNGIKFGYDPITKINGTTNPDNGPGFSFSTAPSPDSTLMLLRVARFHRLFDLDMQLQLMESESKGKVISSPKVITQNKKAAEISTNDSRYFKTTTTTTTGTTESFTEVQASMGLKVTPHVTNEGSIAMDVELNKAGFGTQEIAGVPPTKTSRFVKTNILVDNGSTVVIGGIYSFEKNEKLSGLPFLKDLPLVGWLFRTAYNPTKSKNELIIFLTPRVINQEEAGLIESDDGVS
ncbi:MAG: type IV pilus secretin PilQ [Oligoflexia bacterium]|nr:type IV pilus secretin PilQ [Oligoflexia bacterium]